MSAEVSYLDDNLPGTMQPEVDALEAEIALLAAEAQRQSVRGLFLTAAAPWVLGERDGQVGGLPEDFVRFVTAQKDRTSVPYAQTCFELGDQWMFHKPPGPGVATEVRRPRTR